MLISMMKILGSIEFLIQLEKGRIRVGGNNIAAHNGNKLDKSEIDNKEVGGDRVDDEVRKKGRNLSKSKKMELGFFIFKARRIFIELR